MSKLRLELACFPTEAVDEFFDENFELDYDAKKGREKNESKLIEKFLFAYRNGWHL